MTLPETVDTALLDFFTKRVGPEAIVDPELVKLIVGLIDGQWQDISTAPTDGSDIIAWNGDRMVIVSWWPAYGWRDDNQGYNGISLWRPLPSPPAKAIRGKA